ncbi:SdpA family antimicrobial peptide system protein [uncultured Chryseobacterium sp.]|uniref:SdpA family antimicrobial peptide system protein n=1 Tax=uncultured Chryseobacterium sp. TaxID=259322 RepID=UPI0025DDD403|nr:SdpA family antimicrobial peptide system protein [uncultured Chryseobacterium sp.]
MKKISIYSIIALFSGLFVVLFIFFKLLSVYLGNNPLNNSQSIKASYVSFFPEGWAFFTKTSKDPKIHIFSVKGNKIKYLNLRNFSSEYYFGISRHNRVLNIEIGNIIQRIKEDSVKSFTIAAKSELNILDRVKSDTLHYSNIIIDNKSIKNFNGKYLISLEIIPPWSLLNQSPEYPSKFVVFPINLIRK